VIDMRSDCTTSPPQVKADASHLEIRPSEIGSASAAARGFPDLPWSAGTGGQPPEPTLVGLRCRTSSSSTAARDHIPSTPPTGVRICRSTAIVRHAWDPLPLPRTTSRMRIGPKGPILFPWGSSPVDGSGLGFQSTIGPAAGLFLSSGLSLNTLQPIHSHPSTRDLDR
jgi:hypothetical protein